jgi:hypothetical protein
MAAVTVSTVPIFINENRGPSPIIFKSEINQPLCCGDKAANITPKVGMLLLLNLIILLCGIQALAIQPLTTTQ